MAYTARMPKDYGQTCPVARSLEFLGERWTLLLIRDLLAGPRKFQEFSASLHGVAPTVLSHRLKVLETHGIVSRRLYSEHPPRAEYTLTDRGRELRPVVRALGIWGARHLGATWNFVHEACGAAVESAYYCPDCDELVASDQVTRQPVSTRKRRSK
jgi:DNA-binding HxlR family transcriptional regulator